MILAAVFVVILASPSIQLVLRDNQSLKEGNILKRSSSWQTLKPKDLYFCSLKAKGMYRLRSICEKSFEIQQEAHHCTSRRLLMMRIDHQLAYLQRMVLLTILQKTMNKTRPCNYHASQGSGAKNITLLQQRHMDLNHRQSKKLYEYPKLKQTRDNLTETIANIKVKQMKMQDILRNITDNVENNNVKLNIFSETRSNKTKGHIRTPTTSSNLTACNAYLGDLVMAQLDCSAHTLPKLQERSRAKNQSMQKTTEYHRALQYNITNCRSGVLQSKSSDVCDKLQTTISHGNTSRVELQQISKQLADCTFRLGSIKREIPRCESHLSRGHSAHHNLLINVTERHIREREMEMSVMQCETRLSMCRENITVCKDLTAELEDSTAGCWSDLDKWKFRTDLCEGQVSMLLQNINATEDFIGDMRAKLRTDKAELESCQSRQLEHRSSHAQEVLVLGRLSPELKSKRASLAACHARCPHLQKSADTSSRCPVVDHGLDWHQGSTGCFFVSRPGAGHARMSSFCEQQAPGAALVRLSSVPMAEDAYSALLSRYLAAARDEPLRKQGRAWVQFEDGFEYAGFPVKSHHCEEVTCACWTMRFPWKGRSQLFECEEANLPAICYIPLAGQ